MLSSSLIVGLWFLPVMLFIIIPLSMLSIWSVHKLLKLVVEKLEQVVRNARVARDYRAPKFRPRAAV